MALVLVARRRPGRATRRRARGRALPDAASAAPGACRAAASSSGARSSVFDGMHAQYVHSPPTSARSTSVIWKSPSSLLSAPTNASPAEPPPSTTTRVTVPPPKTTARGRSRRPDPPTSGQLEAGAVELGLQPLPAELVGDLGPHLLTRRELHLEVEVGDAHALVDSERRSISTHSFSASHRATCPKRSGSKSPPSSRLITCRTLRLNSAVTPRESLYAASSRAGSLTRSVPSSNASPAPSSPWRAREKACALLAREVADRRAEEGEEPPPPFGKPHEMTLEVADDAVHLDPRILVRDRCCRLPQRLLGDVEGHEASEVAGLDHRVEQEPGLLGRARAWLDERVRLRQRRDVVGTLGENDPLAAREVVLGQPRDLVEERGAALVVEPLRRQLLRRRREAPADVLSQGLEAILRREVDVDLQRGRAAPARRSRVPRAAEAGEDLPADGEVPVAERHAGDRRRSSPTRRRAAPCSRGRRTPRSTPGTGTPGSPDSRRSRTTSTPRPRRRRAALRASPPAPTRPPSAGACRPTRHRRSLRPTRRAARARSAGTGSSVPKRGAATRAVALPGERRLGPAAVGEERRVVAVRHRLDVDAERAVSASWAGRSLS